MKPAFQRLISPFQQHPWLMWLIPLAWPVVLIGLVAKYGVNVPFWDQWELVDIYQKSLEGRLTLTDLWAQHNEHRILFPRIIDLGLAYLTRWSTYVELFFSIFVMLIAGFILVLMIRRTFSSKSRLQVVGISFMALGLLYSPNQWENWLWGWQIEWFLTVLMVVLAVWSLTRTEVGRWRSLAIAIGAAFVATYSLGSGILLWVALAPALFILGYNRRHQIAWAAATVATVASYYVGYHNPGGQPSKLLLLQQPLEFVLYVLGYLGRPLGYGPRSAVAAGALLLVLIVASTWYLLARRYKLARLTPWLSLAAFAGMSAVVTGMSRLGYGLQQGLSSRYTTISTLFAIATLILAVMAAMELYRHYRKQTSKLFVCGLVIGAVFAVCGLGFVRNYSTGINHMERQSLYLTDIKNCLPQATYEDDLCLLSAYPVKDIVWERLEYLRKIHWGGL